MFKLSILSKGTIVCAALLSVCNLCQAQPGKQGPAKKPAVVAAVATETIPTTLKKYVGTVDPIEKVDEIARVSGDLVVAKGFEEGSVVKKGQLLFQIDPIRYEANVKSAEATIAQTQAHIAYSKSNYERLQALYDKNAGSKDDAESALSDLRAYEAQLAQAQAQLILAKHDLHYTKVVASIDGRVGRVSHTTGNYVTPQSGALVTIVQTNPIYVCFSMSSRDFVSLYNGDVENLKKTASIQLKLADDSVYDEPGEISFINNEVKTTTDTIKVWATFQNEGGRLNAGGVVAVNVAKRAENSTAAIAPSAVMFDGKSHFVYVLVDSVSDDDLFNGILEDSRFGEMKKAFESGEKSRDQILAEFKERYAAVDPKTGEKTYEFENGKVVLPGHKLALRRNVEIGTISDSLQAIKSGLKAGELVAVDGTHKIKPFELARPAKATGSEDAATEKAEVATAPKKEQPAPKAAAKTNAKKESRSFLARLIQGDDNE